MGRRREADKGREIIQLGIQTQSLSQPQKKFWNNMTITPFPNQTTMPQPVIA
jgi:hypothetical protein